MSEHYGCCIASGRAVPAVSANTGRAAFRTVSHEHFDIDRLAAYLHLTPQQVTRLAERGKLPGRKVAGRWRFSQAEVHHWLETRIGLSDEEELIDVEDLLQRSSGAEQEKISVGRLLPIEAVGIPLPARTRNSVIVHMAELAGKTGWLWDPRKMAEAVRSREDMHSTALENGVALLHPRRPMARLLERPLLALGRTASRIPFGADVMTDIFFLICSTTDRGHLRTLARLSRILAAPGFLDTLRDAPDAETAHQQIVDAEAKL